MELIASFGTLPRRSFNPTTCLLRSLHSRFFCSSCFFSLCILSVLPTHLILFTFFHILRALHSFQLFGFYLPTLTLSLLCLNRSHTACSTRLERSQQTSSCQRVSLGSTTLPSCRSTAPNQRLRRCWRHATHSCTSRALVSVSPPPTATNHYRCRYHHQHHKPRHSSAHALLSTSAHFTR